MHAKLTTTRIYTLPETTSSPLKIGQLPQKERIVLNNHLFSAPFAVSFRLGYSLKDQIQGVFNPSKVDAQTQLKPNLLREFGTMRFLENLRDVMRHVWKWRDDTLTLDPELP